MKKSLPDTRYDGIIKLLTKSFRMWNTDHLRLCIEAKGMKNPDNKRDFARVLRSAASRGLCKKLDQYQRSLLRNQTNIPRAMWTHPMEDIKL